MTCAEASRPPSVHTPLLALTLWPSWGQSSYPLVLSLSASQPADLSHAIAFCFLMLCDDLNAVLHLSVSLSRPMEAVAFVPAIAGVTLP